MFYLNGVFVFVCSLKVSRPVKSVESGHSEWILLEEEDFLPTPRTDPKVIRVHKRMFFFPEKQVG